MGRTAFGTWMTTLVYLLSFASGCKEKTGIESLPVELRPIPGAKVRHYRVKHIRCPYYLEPFPAQDGRKGGGKCVNITSLHIICTVGVCEAMPGDPPGGAAVTGVEQLHRGPAPVLNSAR